MLGLRRIDQLGGKCSSCGEYVELVATRRSLRDSAGKLVLGVVVGIALMIFTL